MIGACITHSGELIPKDAFVLSRYIAMATLQLRAQMRV